MLPRCGMKPLICSTLSGPSSHPDIFNYSMHNRFDFRSDTQQSRDSCALLMLLAQLSCFITLSILSAIEVETRGLAQFCAWTCCFSKTVMDWVCCNSQPSNELN